MRRYWENGFGMLQWTVLAGGAALLSSVAYVYGLPAYQDYQVKSQVSEVFASADACRAEVSQIVQRTTAPVLSISMFGCDGGASSGVKISRHLKSIAVSSAGAITLTLDYRSLLGLTPFTSTLTLVPLSGPAAVLRTDDVNKTIFAWRCGSAKDGTTIPGKFLPSNCRG